MGGWLLITAKASWFFGSSGECNRRSYPQAKGGWLLNPQATARARRRVAVFGFDGLMKRTHPHRQQPTRASKRAHDPTRIRINLSDPGTALWCGPAMLGFWPDRSVVIMVCQRGRIECGMRVDLDAPLVDAIQQLERATSQFSGALLLLLGYGERDDVTARLREMQFALDPQIVIDVLGTDRHQWWTLNGDVGDMPGTMSAQLVAGSSRGANLLPSRDAVAQAIAGPSRERKDLLEPLTRQALDWFSGREPAERELAMRELLDQADADGACSLTTAELLRLAVLTLDPHARDIALLAMRRSNATAALELWRGVVQVSCDDLSPGPLCLTANAAWLSGDGALLTMCLQRCEAIDAGFSLFQLLADVQWSALPPAQWEEILASAGQQTQAERRRA